MQEVVIAPADAAASFAVLTGAKERGSLWHRRQWAPGVLVATDGSGGPRRRGRRPLHVELMALTARACCVCDAAGSRPFPSDKMLLRHVEEAHSRALCHVCLKAHRKFPLELEALSGEALAAHLESHPACQFCTVRFLDSDALWAHMREHHFTCHVCERGGVAHQYFPNAGGLIHHMRECHYLCEEPGCADCLVAFATREDLHRHNTEVHSGHMPRWNASAARPMQLDISHYLDRGQERAAARGRGDGRRGGGGGVGRRGSSPAVMMDGDLLVVDDDLPPPASARAHGSAGPGPGPAPVDGGAQQLRHGAWATRGSSAAHLSAAAEFPSLAEAIAVSLRPEAAAPARPPPLVRRSLRCPCGRRVRHIAAVEGEEVAGLACDGSCAAAAAAEARTQQLASAFGVDDHASHTSYWDRNRTPTYSAELLQVARSSPAFVSEAEAELARFLADATGGQRHALRPMPRSQRAVVHSLAEQYGVTSQSYGHEPNRRVALFKAPTSSIPNRLLTEVAAEKSEHDIRQIRESETFELHLLDLEDESCLHSMLREWAGEYELKRGRAAGEAAASVRFSSLQHLKAAAHSLAGGLRGKFRVDPRSAAAALARSEHAPPSAAANQPPPRHTAFTATAAVSRSQPPSGRPGGAVMGAEWRQVGPGGSSGQPQGVAAPSAPDPWFEGEAVPVGAALGAQDGDEALDDWEQAAALISDDAAGATPGDILRSAGAPLSQGNMFNLLNGDD